VLASANCSQNHEIAFPANVLAANRLGATQQEKYGLDFPSESIIPTLIRNPLVAGLGNA